MPLQPSLSPSEPSTSLGELESRIGQRWIAWLGAVVVFFSAAFFLKHAFDKNWIGPAGQVLISAVVGLLALAAGSYFTRKEWRILGQAVIGLGLAILYAAFYASFSLFDPAVLSQQSAFAFMIAVTVAGVSLAVWQDAATIAFLAVLGGFLTPVLVSTGQDARDTLFTYLLMLDVGVIAVAMFRSWRLLDALAMAGTFILYIGWFAKFYEPEAMVPSLLWLGSFYLVFLVLPCIHQLYRKVNFTPERLSMLVVNGLFTAFFAWQMLGESYLFQMGFICLGMAAVYLALAWLIRRRLPADIQVLFAAVAMAVAFATLSVPMQFNGDGILLAWLAEAAAVTYLAYRLKYSPARAFGAAILILAIGRFFFTGQNWPLHTQPFNLFLNRQFVIAMAVPAAAAICAMIHHRFRGIAGELDNLLKALTGIVAGVLCLLILNVELHGWLEPRIGELLADAVTATLCAAGSVAFLLAGTGSPRFASAIWLIGAIVFILAAAVGASLFSRDYGPGRLPLVNVRFLVNLAMVGIAFAYGKVLHLAAARNSHSPFRVAATAFIVAGIVSLLVLLSVEIYSYCIDTISVADRARRVGQMSITVVWSVYAAGLLFAGFYRHLRPLRLSGLALFGIAAGKLAMVDLTHLNDIHRIISFLVLGLLMLCASYLYHKLESRLSASTAGQRP